MLTARVIPGKVFADQETLDYGKVNALGSPTVVLEGTLDSTQVEAVAQRQWVDVRNFGYIGDGARHPVSSAYATYELAAAAFPLCTRYNPLSTDLTDELDWCALQEAIYSILGPYQSGYGGMVSVPAGRGQLNRAVQITPGVDVMGMNSTPVVSSCAIGYGNDILVGSTVFEIRHGTHAECAYIGEVGGAREADKGLWDLDDMYDRLEDMPYDRWVDQFTADHFSANLKFILRASFRLNAGASLRRCAIYYPEQFDMGATPARSKLLEYAYAIYCGSCNRVDQVWICNAYRGIKGDQSNWIRLSNLLIGSYHRGIYQRRAGATSVMANISIWNADPATMLHPNRQMAYNAAYDSPLEHAATFGQAITISQADGVHVSDVIIHGQRYGFVLGCNAWVNGSNLDVEAGTALRIMAPIHVNMTNLVCNAGLQTNGVYGGGTVQYGVCPGNTRAIDIHAGYGSIRLSNMMVSGQVQGVVVTQGDVESSICLDGLHCKANIYNGTVWDGVVGPHLMVGDEFLGQLTVNGTLNPQRCFVAGNNRVTMNGAVSPVQGPEIANGSGGTFAAAFANLNVPASWTTDVKCTAAINGLRLEFSGTETATTHRITYALPSLVSGGMHALMLSLDVRAIVSDPRNIGQAFSGIVTALTVGLYRPGTGWIWSKALSVPPLESNGDGVVTAIPMLTMGHPEDVLAIEWGNVNGIYSNPVYVHLTNMKVCWAQDCDIRDFQIWAGQPKPYQLGDVMIEKDIVVDPATFNSTHPVVIMPESTGPGRYRLVDMTMGAYYLDRIAPPWSNSTGTATLTFKAKTGANFQTDSNLGYTVPEASLRRSNSHTADLLQLADVEVTRNGAVMPVGAELSRGERLVLETNVVDGDWRPYAPLRVNTTAYIAGDWRRVSAGRVFVCTTGGTSAAAEPGGLATAAVGDSLADGTVTWKCQSTSYAQSALNPMRIRARFSVSI
jgi:hypothetical protein